MDRLTKSTHFLVVRMTLTLEEFCRLYVREIVRYLKYTITYGLHYTRYPPVLEGYSDANWISDNIETKSTSGYAFT